MSTGRVAVAMPKLGDTVTEGMLAEWHVSVGDEIREGQPLAEIETDKVTMDYPSEVAGVIEELPVQAGETVPVGTVIAYVRTIDGAAEGPPDAGAPAPAVGDRPVAPRWNPRATGAARRVAAALGVAIERAQGTGRSGRITRVDVEALAHEASPREKGAAPPGIAEAPSAMRAAIARRMTEAWGAHAHAMLAADVPAVALLDAIRDARHEGNGRVGRDPSPLPLVVHSVAQALGGAAERVDLGIAVAVDAGLVVPVLRDAGRPWRELDPDLQALVADARGRRLDADAFTGGTATITNLGGMGVRWSAPILNGGQSTIWGVGAIRAVPADGSHAPAWEPVLPISLVYDAAALDAVGAGRLIGRFTTALDAAAAPTA